MNQKNAANKSWNPPQKPISVGIVGARGYSGLELCRLLLRHPNAVLMHIYATEAFSLHDYLDVSAAQKIQGQPIEKLFDHLHDLKTVFLATPVEVSSELTPKLLEAGINVIDLSGAYRLQSGSQQDQQKSYNQWYRFKHNNLSLLSQAHYGLQPFLKANSLFSPQLISNPGCYATAAMMGLAPLLKAGLIDPSDIIIDGKSGTTGAGKKAEERLLHSEVSDNCLPYRMGQHQHQPEIEQTLSSLSDCEVSVQFTPHLLPFRRGILCSMYVKTKASIQEINEAYINTYRDDVLTELLTLPSQANKLNLRRVIGTGKTLIGWQMTGPNRLSIFTMIDNLMKGAASQAIENFNTMHGLERTTALADLEGII